MEHEEEARRLEREAERLEHESDRVGGDIDEARDDWDTKEQDASVPGAQPDPEEELVNERDDAGDDTEQGG